MERWKRYLLLLAVLLCLLSSGCEKAVEYLHRETIAVMPTTSLEPERKAKESLSQIQLPSTYDSRTMGRTPKVKNQNQDNNCWAYAALTALEATLLPDYQENFSIEHLIQDWKPYIGTQGGGAYTMSMAYLLSWRGPVLEDSISDHVENVNHRSELETLQNKNNDSAESVWHVKEIQILEGKEIDKIKNAVYTYGAVQTSFYSDFLDTIEESKWYQPEYSAYCSMEEGTINHDVVILGWDDAFPKEHFRVQPQEDGAFLCLNSWGEEFGENGYFYVSYEDAVIGTYSLVYSKVEQALPNQFLYETDERGWSGQIGYEQDTMWFSNVYQAEEDETLCSAGTYFTEAGQSYEVYFVKDWENSSDFSRRELVGTGTIDFMGYAEIPFQETQKLRRGERFAVVVKLKSPQGVAKAAMEIGEESPDIEEKIDEVNEIDEIDEVNKVDEINEVDEIDEVNRVNEIDNRDAIREKKEHAVGNGYISWNGSDWEQIQEKDNCELCLKAYTIRGKE